MKCTACGNENQPGAKFCVHCGVVLSLTAPSSAIGPTTSAPLGSTSTGQRPALAPQAPPVQTVVRPAAPPVAAPPPPAAPPPAGTEVPAVPAQSSSRSLVIAGIAIVVVLGIAGYVGYRMLAGEGSKQVTATAEPPKAETPPAPSAEPGKESATTPEPPSSVTAASSPPAPAGSAAATPSASTAPPLPGQPATTEGVQPRTSVAKTTPKTAPAQPVQTMPAQATPAAPAATPAPRKALPPTPTVTAQVDRWQMYADEMAQCAKESFFARVGCQQRTRAHYCDGYWGKVAQCPGNAPVDHGQ